MDLLRDNMSIADDFLSSIYNNSSQLRIILPIINNNNNNTTTLFSMDIYPSGYTLPEIIIASIVVTILMIIIVVGNMLVIIAISTEKSLKNIQNWFIASLAVADFFLGLVIMPFSLANELMGYWIFGSWWCDIHSAMDVLLCTASINNLCLISLDRYWSITKAVEYLKTRTPARAVVMITTVWIVSALVCIPPLLGWKATKRDGDLPQCQLSENLGYVLYSALGSFYIPSCIMVFVYIRIYYAAKRRARRGIKKQRKSQTEQVTSFTSNSMANPNNNLSSAALQLRNQQIATIQSEPVSDPLSIPTVTCDLASDQSPNDSLTYTSENPKENKNTLKVNAIISAQNQSPDIRSPFNSTKEFPISPTFGRCRTLSVGIDSDMISEFEPSSSDSGIARKCAVVKPRKFRLYQSIFSKPIQRCDIQTHIHAELAELEPALPKIQKPRDPEKEKRRIARKKEKRATLILGLIMGSFIACWLPFFFLYILIPACKKCKIPPYAFKVAFWLGYMNSALNPAIYTIFNKDFRRAFRRILFK